MIRRLLALFKPRGGTMPRRPPSPDERVVQLSPGSGEPELPDSSLPPGERAARYMAMNPPKSKARQQTGKSCETCRELGSKDPEPVAFTEKFLSETHYYCEGHWPGWYR